MHGKIFINYRREDSEATAVRIYDTLLKNFTKKQLFIDIHAITPGEDFETVIKHNINKSDIFLAIIGPTWLQSIDAKADVTDYVRFEISTALESNVKVIPILLGNTKMPSSYDLPKDLKKLSGINAFIINSRSFKSDFESLLNNVKKIINEKQSIQQNLDRNIRKTLVFLLVACLLVPVINYFWSKKEFPVSNYLNKSIISVTSPGRLSIRDLSTGYWTPVEKNEQCVFAAFPDCTILVINTAPAGISFYYLLKWDNTETIKKINFKEIDNKLYVNDKLKAVCIIDTALINLPTDSEINDLETITIKTEKLSDSQLSYLTQVLQTNQHISIINESADEEVVGLINQTTPEILICNTSDELGQVNLTEVTSAVISGAGSTVSPYFYNDLILPKLKNLVAVKTEINKILVRNSAKFITCGGDTTLTELSVLKNRDNIIQLQILDDNKNDYVIDFNDLREYKNLKSFGYYNETHKPFTSSINGMISLNIHNVNLLDIAQLALNNPDLEQLTISFSNEILDLDWAADFKKLRFLSIKKYGKDYFSLDSINVAALSKLNHLESFSIDAELDKNSNQYNNLVEACPKCIFSNWLLITGMCLGSGWLLLFFPAFIVIIIMKKSRQEQNFSLTGH